MSDFELLSYPQIAERMKIKLASVRQTVSRRGWKRIKTNDGKTLIEVPVVYLQTGDSRVESDATVDTEVSVLKTANAVLTAELAASRDRVSELTAERDIWREMARQSIWQRLFGRR